MSARVVKQFVKDIEEHIYKTELIYRTILVTVNVVESHLLKNELTRNDYSAVVIEEDISIIDNYNQIDDRIVILPHFKFKEFILHLEENGGLLASSFNFIALSYAIDEDTVNTLIEFYVNKTNNNEFNTIIFDKSYAQLLYLDYIKK